MQTSELPTPSQPQASRFVRPKGDRGPYAPVLEHGESVLWLQRSIPASVAAALDEVAQGDVFESKASLDIADLDLSGFLAPVSNPTARRFLADDVASVSRDFCAALGRRHVHGLLAVITNDKCRKFHSDNVTVRLLCTYAGPGTEWVRNEDVVRENLGRTDVDYESANRSVLRVPDAVQYCTAGDVILLKGEAFDGNRGSGAVHRSPPVEERSLRRLLFKIDEQACGC